MQQNLPDPGNLERSAWHYDTRDGITEFLAGFLFFVIGRAVVDPHLAWVPALAVFPLRWVSRLLKERYAYPRVGLVKVRSESGSSLGRGMLTYLAVVVAVLAAGLWVFGDVTDGGIWLRWLPAAVGALSAGGFFYLAGRTGRTRHWALALFSVAWGIVCAAWLDAPGRLGLQRFATGFGLACLLTGAVVFVHFLRTHPVRDPEVADEPA